MDSGVSIPAYPDVGDSSPSCKKASKNFFEAVPAIGLSSNFLARLPRDDVLVHDDVQNEVNH